MLPIVIGDYLTSTLLREHREHCLSFIRNDAHFYWRRPCGLGQAGNCKATARQDETYKQASDKKVHGSCGQCLLAQSAGRCRTGIPACPVSHIQSFKNRQAGMPVLLECLSYWLDRL